MDQLTGHRPQLRCPYPWLLLVLVGGILAIASPAQSGSAPSGSASGVNPVGINQGQDSLLITTTPNATVNAITGEVLLTAAAQQALNQVAPGIPQGLASSNPALALLLVTPATINLGLPAGVGEENTIGALAATAVAAINAGDSVALTLVQGSLTIEAPTTDPGTTTAVWTTPDGTQTAILLSGSREQIANAAGFLTAALAAGLPPGQLGPFVDFALAGADYMTLVALFNAIAGLLSPPAGTADINATQLEAAIQAYNRILDDSDAATVTALAQNPDFVALGRSLQQLRAAIN